MNIRIIEKPVQQQRPLGNDANSWPKDSGTIWRVVSDDGRDDFKLNDLLLILGTTYRGWAVINLRSNSCYTSTIKDGYQIKVVQDFTVNQVVLYVDNTARP